MSMWNHLPIDVVPYFYNVGSQCYWPKAREWYWKRADGVEFHARFNSTDFPVARSPWGDAYRIWCVFAPLGLHIPSTKFEQWDKMQLPHLSSSPR
jgi:hypothetical protein